MKIHAISDLHLEVQSYNRKAMPDADVLVLAGDIVRLSNMDRCCAQEHFEDWAKKYPHVLVIMGNHEHYNYQFSETAKDYRKFLSQWPNVTLLDNEIKVIDDVLFVGSTMWTNFGDGNPTVQIMADEGITDFRSIKHYSGDEPPAYFKVRHAWKEFLRSKSWMSMVLDDDALAEYKGVVVISHFCPSYKSIHPKWGNDPLNYYFSSDCEHLMETVDLWIHGHTHSSFDYQVKAPLNPSGYCRVVCNPKGYGRENSKEFNPNLILEIDNA